jgi:hypothetical protein
MNMKRFFGMMPSNEIVIEKRYEDTIGLRITIQAGLHGWTIIYADNSTDYKDIDDTAEANFKAAYDLAIERLRGLAEIKEEHCCER